MAQSQRGFPLEAFNTALIQKNKKNLLQNGIDSNDCYSIYDRVTSFSGDRVTWKRCSVENMTNTGAIRSNLNMDKQLGLIWCVVCLVVQHTNHLTLIRMPHDRATINGICLCSKYFCPLIIFRGAEKINCHNLAETINGHFFPSRKNCDLTFVCFSICTE